MIPASVEQLERSCVQWGQTSIPYGVRRSRRRSTVSIAIHPRDGVLLTAPAATPIARLDRVVHAKARWIVERLRRGSVLPPQPAQREFVDGETFHYLGRQYRLRVEPRLEGVALRRGLLVAGVQDARRGSGGGAEHVRDALVCWYRQHAAERLPDFAGHWARRLGVTVNVALRDQRARWGSCDRAGSLRLNWRIIQAPRTCIEYVVAHEVVHVRHPNHTPAFWGALGRVMPDYEQRRTRLRELGPSLVW